MANQIYNVVLQNINISPSNDNPGTVDAWLTFALMSNQEHRGEVRILATGKSGAEPAALVQGGMKNIQTALTAWTGSLPQSN